MKSSRKKATAKKQPKQTIKSLMAKIECLEAENATMRNWMIDINQRLTRATEAHIRLRSHVFTKGLQPNVRRQIATHLFAGMLASPRPGEAVDGKVWAKQALGFADDLIAAEASSESETSSDMVNLARRVGLHVEILR
jgi:hypothetical protein